MSSCTHTGVNLTTPTGPRLVLLVIAVVELFQSIPDCDVNHIVAESDGFGYDISIRLPGDDFFLHLEVKSPTRRGRLSFFLSRNEFEQMRRDKCWFLMAIRLNQALEAVSLSTVDHDWLRLAVPTDNVGGRWEAVRLDVPQNAIRSGFNPVRARLDLNTPPLLNAFPIGLGNIAHRLVTPSLILESIRRRDTTKNGGYYCVSRIP